MSIFGFSWQAADRRKGRRATRLLALTTALAAMLAAAAPACAETLLRARLNSDILSSEPGMRRDDNTDAVLMHVVEGLVGSKEDGSVGPLLASGWKVSPDGRTYTFALRQGVYFHNGQPLTSADAVWSLKRYFDPKAPWRCRSEFGPNGMTTVKSVSAPDARTVVIALDRPAPLLLKTLARTDCGGSAILSPASVGSDGKWRTPIGTGPFQFGGWKRNQYIDLLKFPRYAPLAGPRDGNVGGKHALVDRIRFMIIPDSSSARAALLRGNLDVVDGVAPNELGGFRGQKGVRLEMSPTLDFFALLLQTRDPVLKDVRMRQAIALSIDTVGLAKAVTWGTGRADNSPVPAISPYFTPAHAGLRKVNIAEAKRLAKAAGYKGQPISIVTNRRYPQMFDMAVLVQAMAAQAGIKMKIDTLDWATQSSRYASGDYQAMTHGFSARPDPSMNFAILIGDKNRDPRRVWDTPRAKALLLQSVSTDVPAERQAAFDALQKDLMQEVPAVVLFNSSRITAVRSNVTGYKSWPSASQRLWGVGLR